MDLIGFLYGFGFLHGVVLAGILLYSQRGNRGANAFMATLILCIAICFLFSWLIRTDFFMENPQWSLLSAPLEFAWGPLLYLYAYTMSGRSPKWLQVLHFFPCVLLFHGPISFSLYPAEQQQEFLSFFWGNRENPELVVELLRATPVFWRIWIEFHLQGSLFALQFGIYCYLVLRQIHQHNLNLEQHFSFTEQMNLRWLRILTSLCVLFLLLFLTFNRARLVLFGQFEITELSPNMPFLFLVLGLYIIGMGALYQPRIQREDNEPAGRAPEREQTPEPTIDRNQPLAADPVLAANDNTYPSPPVEAPQPAPDEAKYARSGISLDDAQRYKIRLMETMQEQKLYLDCDLTLRDLAEHADMSYHQASQVINGQMHQRFFSFVNNYRIQLAMEMLADSKTSKMPIVELALEVGFKSKSSFYDAFKKMTQMTPSQYKKSLLETA